MEGKVWRLGFGCLWVLPGAWDLGFGEFGVSTVTCKISLFQVSLRCLHTNRKFGLRISFFQKGKSTSMLALL